MFRTLIVPLDGSEQAEQALPFAARLTGASGRVVLVRAALGPPPSGQDWEQQQVNVVDEAEAYLEVVAAKLATRVSVATMVPYGQAAEEIVKSVQEFGADAIVMTTHGRTGFDHLLHGSVAEAVLSKANVPVLLVHTRTGEAMAAPFDPPSARILVPLDGSRFAETAIPLAVELLGLAGELLLVSVAPEPDHVERDERGNVIAYIDQQEESVKRPVLDYLMTLTASIKAQHPGIHVAYDAELAYDPAARIVGIEAERAIDLVVMATHGRTGLDRARLGSVAGEVVREGFVPVLLVPPGLAERLTVPQPA